MLKKIIRAILSSLIFFAIGMNIKAQEITWSDWSTKYPSGIAEEFIESDTWYKWYKIEDGTVDYTNEYSKTKDGYTADLNSARTFYRYITNSMLIYNSAGLLVDNVDYCQKNFCFSKIVGKPNLVSTDDKIEEAKYDENDMPSVQQYGVPFTGDTTAYYIVAFVTSTILLMILLKKKKQIKSVS